MPRFHELFMITDNKIQLITIVDHKAETLLETAGAQIRLRIDPLECCTISQMKLGYRISQFWAITVDKILRDNRLQVFLLIGSLLELAQEYLTVRLKPRPAATL